MRLQLRHAPVKVLLHVRNSLSEPTPPEPTCTQAAQSLRQTGLALLFALLGFGLMWLLGLMPHQQTSSLLARQAVVEAARKAQEAAAALAGLEGMEGPAEEAGGPRAAAAASAMMGADAEYREGASAGGGTCPGV